MIRIGEIDWFGADPCRHVANICSWVVGRCVLSGFRLDRTGYLHSRYLLRRFAQVS